MKNSKRIIANMPTENLSQKLLAKRYGVRIWGVTPVKISEITDKGFFVEFLDRKIYFNRRRFPYFNDATEKEIRDVALLWESHLRWKTLDLDFYELEQIDNPPETITFPIYVRGIPRPDLFADYWDGEHWTYRPYEDKKGGEL